MLCGNAAAMPGSTEICHPVSLTQLYTAYPASTRIAGAGFVWVGGDANNFSEVESSAGQPELRRITSADHPPIATTKTALGRRQLRMPRR